MSGSPNDHPALHSSDGRRLRIQLWSYNYDPEPAGIGPLSTVWAAAMRARGHDVEVVAAHPHYPEPQWGRRLRPYREMRDGVRVTRLPIWFGRASRWERLRQEASYTALLSLALPLLGRPDLIVAVSPSFPALVPAIMNTRVRRVPWVLWLQDILPDGAVSTQVLEDGRIVRLARALEKTAYRSAAAIVVLSSSFESNLVSKGVEPAKIAQIYNPATGEIRPGARPAQGIDPRLVLTMGNIGHSQGLAAIVEAFERSAALEALSARFVLAGDGVAGDEVRKTIRTDRVTVTGILGPEPLQRELDRAAVAVVSQCYEGAEFNVPSKLMNFMANGLPVVASVRPESEVARILRESGCGWVTDSRSPDECATVLAEVLQRPEELERRGTAGLEFARRSFVPSLVADRFEAVMQSVTE